jgi:elongation factor P hydroxylase
VLANEAALRVPRSRAIIRYNRDYARSALHEIAHWCIAGSERRQRVDYGYSYHPPPRNVAQQQAFFFAERRVQGLERLFALAVGIDFRVSADNVAVTDVGLFAADVVATSEQMRAAGLAGRARSMIDAFLRHRTVA